MEELTAFAATLPRSQNRILTGLLSGDPALVESLFGWVNRTPGIYSKRQQQMRIGGTVSTINKKIAKFRYRIVPGPLRGFYELVKLADDTETKES